MSTGRYVMLHCCCKLDEARQEKKIYVTVGVLSHVVCKAKYL